MIVKLNVIKKIPILFLIIMIAGVLLAAYNDSDAASVGKKKKGISAKKATEKKQAGTSKKNSKKSSSAIAKAPVKESIALSAVSGASETPAKNKSTKSKKSKKSAKQQYATLESTVVIGDDETFYGTVKEKPLAATDKHAAQMSKSLNAPEEVKSEKRKVKINSSESIFSKVSKYLGTSESRLKWFPGLYLNLGANVLEDPVNQTHKIWTKLGFIPRFSYDKLSCAYDLTFYFNESNSLRKEDWDSIDDYIRKIYYVYYGEQTDRFSLRIEMMDDLTLGSGAIFRNYCGSLRYPLIDRKTAGLATWNSGYDDSVKLFVDDVASPGIYGISAEIMPHDHLQFGAQYVTDNKVNTGLGNESIAVSSLHLGIPLVSKSDTKFKIYEEIGKINGYGSGMHTGVVTEMKDFTFKNEFRVFNSNYIPNYFNTLYEMERHFKGRELIRLRDNGEKYSGWFNEIKARLSDKYTFRLSYEKDYAPYLKPMLSIGVDYTGMEYSKLKLSFNYDRKNLYYSGSKQSDAIYGIKTRYDISDSSSVVYELRHILDTRGKPADSVNVETQLRF